MVVPRAVAAVSVILALFIGGTVLAGPAVAQTTTPAAQAVTPAAAHLTNPNIVEITHGPYRTRSECEVNLFTVEQDWPFPIRVDDCFGLPPGNLFFNAYYDV